jgi:hypothetical protein
MDPFELLKADHEKVAQLFDRLETNTGKAKLDTFKQIKQELELHTHIEETILYPALESPEETHDLTLEAYEEHKVVKTLLAELSQSRKADDEWQAKAKVLRENVEHHVEEEENELFDKASDALESEQLELLGDEMAAEKARKEGRSGSKGRTKATSKKSTKPGIISRIASAIGLGTAKSSKKTSTKAAKKSTTTKAQKSATKSTTKASSKTTSKSNKPSKASRSTKASKGRSTKKGR